MCKIEKQYSNFNKCKGGKNGLHNHCRNCQKIVRKNWYIKNREAEIKKSAEYAGTEKAKVARNKHYEANKETILEKNRIRRTTPHARNLANIARNKIYHSDMSFRISVNMRSRMRQALKNNVKVNTTIALLGCSIEELKSYLESKFSNGMTWDNYSYKGWHIDHIKPCDSFDLSDYEQQKICFHYSNLQPMWWKDNLSKSNKV